MSRAGSGGGGEGDLNQQQLITIETPEENHQLIMVTFDESGKESMCTLLITLINILTI